jgi:hypothetical protein
MASKLTNLQVIRRAAADTEPTVLDIYTSTEAVIFLGTPHRGSSKAGIAEVVRKIVSVSGFDTTDKNIRALQVNSTELELIHELFMKLYEQKERQFKVLTFQEAKGVSGISYLKLNERVIATDRSPQKHTFLTNAATISRLSDLSRPLLLALSQHKPLMQIICLCADSPAGTMKDISRSWERS